MQTMQYEFSTDQPMAGFNAPIHPGTILLEKYIKPLGLQIKDVAERIGVTRPNLSRVVNGRSGISAEMALKLEAAFGTPASDWTQLQAFYDLAQIRDRADEITEGIEPYARVA